MEKERGSDDHNSKELEGYIKTAFSKGKKVDEIRKELIKAGWPKKIVNQVLEQKAENAPRKNSMSNLQGKTVLKLENVKKFFGNNAVLDGVNLEIKHGDLFGIIGLSGSGKTTLLNALIGFIEPEEGRILFRQDRAEELSSIFDKIRDARQNMGFASQDASFYPKLTVEENLDLYATLYKLPKAKTKAKIEELLSLMELSDSKDTLAQNLSGGMQKRLCVACSMIHEPGLLILDEPTADLDPFLRKEMWNLITKINSTGTTVIIASHFLSEMEHLCSKVGILHNGKIVESGTPEELRNVYSKNEEIHLETLSGKYDGIIKKMKAQKVPISRVVNAGEKIVIYTPEAEKALYSLAGILRKSKEKIIDVDVKKPSLSEVFESFVKAK